MPASPCGPSFRARPFSAVVSGLPSGPLPTPMVPKSHGPGASPAALLMANCVFCAAAAERIVQRRRTRARMESLMLAVGRVPGNRANVRGYVSRNDLRLAVHTRLLELQLFQLAP